MPSADFEIGSLTTDRHPLGREEVRDLKRGMPWIAGVLALSLVAAYALVVPAVAATQASADRATGSTGAATASDDQTPAVSHFVPPGGSHREKHLVGPELAIHAIKEKQLKSTGHL